MSLWMAVIGMIPVVVGFIASRRYLQKNKQVRIVCIITCVFLAFICAVYVGLTLLFVNVVQNQPPV